MSAQGEGGREPKPKGKVRGGTGVRDPQNLGEVTSQSWEGLFPPVPSWGVGVSSCKPQLLSYCVTGWAAALSEPPFLHL